MQTFSEILDGGNQLGLAAVLGPETMLEVLKGFMDVGMARYGTKMYVLKYFTTQLTLIRNTGR